MSAKSVSKETFKSLADPLASENQHSSSVRNLNSGHRMRQSVQACMATGVLTLAKNGILEIC